MSVHQCSQIATQSLQVIGPGKHVLLVADVGCLLIFIRGDRFARSLNLREANALVIILYFFSFLFTSAPCQKSLKKQTKTIMGNILF